MFKEGFIITDNDTKEHILKTTTGFKNYMFLTYQELKNKINFTIDKKSIFKIMKHYNVSYFMAKEYIEAVKLIENKTYNIPKLDSIVSIYNFLDKEGLIKKDKFFINRLSNFPVTFINPTINKEYTKIKELISKYTTVYEIESLNKETYIPTVYEFNTILDETMFIFNKIIDLVNGGASPCWASAPSRPTNGWQMSASRQYPTTMPQTARQKRSWQGSGWERSPKVLPKTQTYMLTNAPSPRPSSCR